MYNIEKRNNQGVSDSSLYSVYSWRFTLQPTAPLAGRSRGGKLCRGGTWHRPNVSNLTLRSIDRLVVLADPLSENLQ